MQVFIQLAGEQGSGKTQLASQLKAFLNSWLSSHDSALCIATQHGITLDPAPDEEVEFIIESEYHPPMKED